MILYQCQELSFYTADARGRWLFKLDFCPNTYVNLHNRCYSWSYTERNRAGIDALIAVLDADTPKCPCNAGRARTDMRFEEVLMGSGHCYATSFPTLQNYGNRVSSPSKLFEFTVTTCQE